MRNSQELWFLAQITSLLNKELVQDALCHGDQATSQPITSNFSALTFPMITFIQQDSAVSMVIFLFPCNTCSLVVYFEGGIVRNQATV